MSQDFKNLAQGLRKARKRRKLTMDEISAATGLSRSTVQRVEAGYEGTTLATFFAYLEGLGLNHKVENALEECLKNKTSGDKVRAQAQKELLKLF